MASSEFQVLIPQDEDELLFLQNQTVGGTCLVQVTEELVFYQSSLSAKGEEEAVGVYTGQVVVISFGVENSDKQQKWAIPHGCGSMTYRSATMDRYEGRFEYGQRSGYGVMAFSSPEIKTNKKRRLSSASRKNTNVQYWGQWERNQMHGRGILQSCNESGNMTYQIAQWSYNKLHGPTYSIIVNPKKKTKVWCIQGEHVNGKLSYGTMKYFPENTNTCIKYEGYIQKTKPSWFGSIQVKNNTRNNDIPRQISTWQYIGEFYTNKSHNDEESSFGMTTPSGYGQMILVNQNRYIGDVCNGKFHGKGKFIYHTVQANVSNNAQPYYDGQWNNGKKCGFGIQIYRGNSSYEGEWFEDEYHGHGILKETNDSKYEGDFVHGLRHGRGTQIFRNGNVYGGRWAHDEQTGFGVMIYHDRTFYEGEWISNVRQGFGKYFNENREILQEGKWYRDRLVSST